MSLCCNCKSLDTCNHYLWMYIYLLSSLCCPGLGVLHDHYNVMVDGWWYFHIFFCICFFAQILLCNPTFSYLMVCICLARWIGLGPAASWPSLQKMKTHWKIVKQATRCFQKTCWKGCWSIACNHGKSCSHHVRFPQLSYWICSWIYMSFACFCCREFWGYGYCKKQKTEIRTIFLYGLKRTLDHLIFMTQP